MTAHVERAALPGKLALRLARWLGAGDRALWLEAIGSERRPTVVRITVELVEVTRQGRREGEYLVNIV